MKVKPFWSRALQVTVARCSPHLTSPLHATDTDPVNPRLYLKHTNTHCKTQHDTTRGASVSVGNLLAVRSSRRCQTEPT